jgi:hypothetical protein
MHRAAMLSSAASLALPYLWTFLVNGIVLGKKVTARKMYVLIFSRTFV